jgi:hypothetical protein
MMVIDGPCRRDHEFHRLRTPPFGRCTRLIHAVNGKILQQKRQNDTFCINKLIRRGFIVLGHHGHYSVRKRGRKWGTCSNDEESHHDRE